MVQVGLESYSEWIQLVADFTISSLTSWQWASGSVYYLLGLWWVAVPLYTEVLLLDNLYFSFWLSLEVGIRLSLLVAGPLPSMPWLKGACLPLPPLSLNNAEAPIVLLS